jgi:hypothetical protein
MSDKQREWSRDWRNFDWSPVEGSIDAVEQGGDLDELGITREEFMEYCEWLSINEKETYEVMILAAVMVQKGLPMDIAAYYSLHPDLLEAILENVEES